MLNKRLNIMKTISKLFDAGFNTKEKILKMQIDDIDKIDKLTNYDLKIISEFRKAIKNNNLIAFLYGKEVQNGEDKA